MIPVVLGPDKRHYVIDHHHLALALHKDGIEDVFVTIVADLTMVDRDAFWGVLDNKRWVYPYDAKGEPGTSRTSQNPVVDLKDDPYRSLAGELRGSAVLPRTRRRSANSFGRISCAGKFRARAWKPISPRRWRKR